MGVMRAVKRPGLVPVATLRERRKGLCEFDGDLITIFQRLLWVRLRVRCRKPYPSVFGFHGALSGFPAMCAKVMYSCLSEVTGGVYDDKVRYSTDATTWAAIQMAGGDGFLRPAIGG